MAESAPRAVPQDFAVALGSHLLDGGIVVKALLFTGLWLSGCGTARLAATVLPQAGLPGQFVAITLAVWNPYVAERLLQGHWSLLVGYGCLPWVATAMLTLRSADRAGWSALFALVFWIALAGLTPTGLMLAAIVALACALGPRTGRPRWLCAGAALIVAGAAALPWLTAFALGTSSSKVGSPAAVAFAARAEPALGTPGSLAGLGGIWNAGAVPGSRTTLFALLATLVLAGVVTAGIPVVDRRPAAVPLLVLAAVSVLVCAALATGPGLAVLRVMAETAPGFGVLRDGQKWVALAVPGYTLAGAGAVVSLRRWLRPSWAALGCCVALIATLPDLAWGVAGKLEPVHYPPGWAKVAAAINTDPRAVAVLPADGMRRFSWSGMEPMLDPLPRWVRAEVLSTGDLTISGHTVFGEGKHARAVQTLLLAGADPAALARAGVGWVVVESATDGQMGAAAAGLAQLPVAYRDHDLILYRVGSDTPGASAGHRRASVIAHLVWLVMLCVGGAGAALAGWRKGRCSGCAKDG